MTALRATLLLALLLARPAHAECVVGKPAPPFALRDREGTLVSLAELAYPGPDRPHAPRQVVLLDFFRTDCKPCIKALPELVALHRRLSGKPVRLLLVALLEDEQGEEKLERFLSARALPFPVLVDAYGVVAKKYLARGNGYEIPALFAVDRTGVLRGRFPGLAGKHRKRIDQLLEELLR